MTKIDVIGLGGLIKKVLTSNPVQNRLVIWGVLVVNGMRQSLKFFLKEPDYNIVVISTFSGLAVPEAQKEEKSTVNVESVKFHYPAVVDYYCIFRGVVDNNNVFRHDKRNNSLIGFHIVWGGI